MIRLDPPNTVPLLVAVSMLLAGCAGTGTPTDASHETDPGAVLGFGGIQGFVLTDAGYPLAGIHVVVLGEDHVAFSDEEGRFGFQNVTARTHLVRADGPGWRAVEAEAHVLADQTVSVNVTMVPRDAQRELPHTHDYWSGQNEVLVTDATFQFHRNEAATPYGDASRIANQYGRLAYTEECIGIYTSSASEFYFNDPAQIVYPGTGRIAITLKWSANDAPNVQGLAIGWKHPRDSTHNLSKLVPNGETFYIDVTPTMWDDAHQRFTFWQFWACLAGKGEEVQGYAPPGRMFAGSFHAKAVLIRGGDIQVDPPHPRFWDNGSVVKVLDSWSNVTCASTLDLCGATSATLGMLNGRANNYVFHRTPDKLVAPGTKELMIRIDWSTDLPTTQPPLSVTYSPADVPPRLKNQQAHFQKLEPNERGDKHRVYLLPIKPTQSDGFYQFRSNWKLLWNVEGQESEPSYVHSCLCKLTIHIQAHVTQDELYAQTVSGGRA